MPLVTVITPSYNHEKYVEEAMKSVLAQSMDDFLYLVCDDSSTDGSWKIIEEVAKKDTRVRAFTHEGGKNRGLAATVQALLERVDTEYVAFLESDDVWERDFLKVMLATAKQRPKAALFYCDIEVFGKNAGGQQKMLAGRRRYAAQEHKELAQLLFNYPVTTFSSVMVRTEALRALDFHTPIANALDKYLWAQLLREKTGIFIPRQLCRWRKYGNSYSDTAVQPERAATWDMLLDVLYPGNTRSDKDFLHTLLCGRKEKIFRSPLRRLACYYLQHKYGRHAVHLERLPLEIE